MNFVEILKSTTNDNESRYIFHVNDNRMDDSNMMMYDTGDVELMADDVSGGGRSGGEVSLAHVVVANAHNMTAHNKSADACRLKNSYLDVEAYSYLFIMVPLALIGIILNLLSLKVFINKSFNTVTFKYIRLITLTDFFICLLVIPYCLTSYTQPFNKYDLYARHFYLAYFYMPGANVAINVSMLLNLLVTIERLISVGWPMHKYTLFKPSRYYLSCVLVFLISFLSNIPNFFIYKVELCQTEPVPRGFIVEKWWSVYGYVREFLTRVFPIILLIIFNIALIYIVKSSRKKMKESVNIMARKDRADRAANKAKVSTAISNDSTTIATTTSPNGNNGEPLSTKNGSKVKLNLIAKSSTPTTTSTQTTTTYISSSIVPSTASASAKHKHPFLSPSNNSSTNVKTSAASPIETRKISMSPFTNDTNELNVLMKNQASKRNRQENQLTWMTIFVGILYSATSIPMVFAYPGLIFSSEQIGQHHYKIYALLVNILELIQCSFRFLIYFCFTTQFRQGFYKLIGFKKRKIPNEATYDVHL